MHPPVPDIEGRGAQNMGYLHTHSIVHYTAAQIAAAQIAAVAYILN